MTQLTLDAAPEPPAFLTALPLRERLLAASLLRGVSPAAALPALLDAPDRLADPPGLSPRLRAAWQTALHDPALPRALAAEREALTRRGAWYLTPADPDWPRGLPPLGVLRGRGRLTTPALAIVGARAADPHGRELAARIARAAVERGHAVVSGGAFGIDHAAHRAALDAGGDTLVVLGSGLDHPSPQSHRALFAAAEARGALLSPFPCARTAAAWTFPQRNAWIAGLAVAVVVVQATLQSGALHTARAALARDLPVWVVPGSIDAPLHAGCHALVAEGARLLTDPAAWAGALRPAVATPAEPREHRALWRAAAAEPRPLDALAADAGLSIEDAAIAATLLELDGWLRPAPGGRYARSQPG
ncbi:MAG: DNA-protecting protein DprA [Myxococcales bacterium]|nr:DNA-protecting protein DprA [Myxococcales bacterium]